MELRTNHAVVDRQDPREGSRRFRPGEPGKIGWAPLCQSDGVTLEAIPAGVTRSFPAWPRMRANETAHGLSSTGIPDRQVTIRFRRRPYHPGYRPIRTCARLDRRRESRVSSNLVPRMCWSAHCRAPKQSWWRGPAGAVQVRSAVNSPVKHRVYMTSNRSCVIATHEPCHILTPGRSHRRPHPVARNATMRK